jgi:hypothetical protein
MNECMQQSDNALFASDFGTWVRERHAVLAGLSLRMVISDPPPPGLDVRVVWIQLRYDRAARLFEPRACVPMSVDQARDQIGPGAPDLEAILKQPISGARAAGRRVWAIVVARCICDLDRITRIIPQSWTPESRVAVCAVDSLARLPQAQALRASLAWRGGAQQRSSTLSRHCQETDLGEDLETVPEETTDVNSQ